MTIQSFVRAGRKHGAGPAVNFLTAASGGQGYNGGMKLHQANVNAQRPVEFSPQLQDYLKGVESQTSRKVQIEYIADAVGGIPGYFFRSSDNSIHIKLCSKFLKPGASDVLIAHEATHGLLLYGRGYAYAQLDECATPVQRLTNSFACSMIDDIVVNKVILDAGFSIVPTYLPVVAKEAAAARKRADCWSEYKSDPDLHRRHYAYRYIMAWNALRFHTSSDRERSSLKQYLEPFRIAYPEAFVEASAIIGLLASDDVFTPSGQREVLSGVLDMWGLGKICRLGVYPALPAKEQQGAAGSARTHVTDPQHDC